MFDALGFYTEHNNTIVFKSVELELLGYSNFSLQFYLFSKVLLEDNCEEFAKGNNFSELWFETGTLVQYINKIFAKLKFSLTANRILIKAH